MNKVNYGNKTSDYLFFHDIDVSQISATKRDITHVTSCNNCISIEHTASVEFVVRFRLVLLFKERKDFMRFG